MNPRLALPKYSLHRYMPRKKTYGGIPRSLEERCQHDILADDFPSEKDYSELAETHTHLKHDKSCKSYTVRNPAQDGNEI
jgi:hypothetical protein